MRRRGAAAVTVLALWAVGLGVLVHREYFRPRFDILAEAAFRVSPGAAYYGVSQGDRQIGFASSTVDTTTSGVVLRDYLVANLPIGGRARRSIARTDVTLNKALRVREFSFSLASDGPALHADGKVLADTELVVAVATGDQRPDTQRVHLDGPILLPTLVPLAISLGERPKVGKRYELPIFDPIGMTPKQVAFTVRAESLFVLSDSAQFDSTAQRWRAVAPDTIRAWQIGTDSPSGFSGWIDEQGRVVETAQLGMSLHRLPYEVAWENWRIEQASSGAAVAEDRDILETTAIAANKALRGRIPVLRVRLEDADLRGYDLNGYRQSLSGNVLTVREEPGAALRASYQLGSPYAPHGPLTEPEPLIQSNDPAIRRTAQRIVGGATDPAVAVERLTRWVHDSVTQQITFGVPDALQVLRSRVGDCNEHTQLFVALARSLGIPTRIAAGLGYIDGKFYYHAWPEVYLRGWVATDPTFGQYPADAAHLRFVVGGLGRQAELLRLMGNLKITVLNTGAAR